MFFNLKVCLMQFVKFLCVIYRNVFARTNNVKNLSVWEKSLKKLNVNKTNKLEVAECYGDIDNPPRDGGWNFQ